MAALKGITAGVGFAAGRSPGARPPAAPSPPPAVPPAHTFQQAVTKLRIGSRPPAIKLCCMWGNIICCWAFVEGVSHYIWKRNIDRDRFATSIKSGWLTVPMSSNFLDTNILKAKLLEAHLIENRFSKPCSLKSLTVNPHSLKRLLCVRSDCGSGACQFRGPREPVETCNNVKSRARKYARGVE